MKPLVLYHAGCWDGFCAAWVARKALGDIDAIPVTYGQPPPVVLGRDVYILDFSYPRDVLMLMDANAEHLRVFDHHKTAEEALAGLSFCMFADDRSGGRLAWEYFISKNPANWLVDYTEDRDLWRHALPYSHEINAALRSYPLNFEIWDDFAKSTPHALGFITEGTAIRRREKQIIKEHVRHARREPWLNGDGSVRDETILVVNATVLFSEIAGELAKGEPFAACYFDREDGKRQWSLRSDDNGIDVSAVAKKFGGGGRFHSAGFETDGLR